MVMVSFEFTSANFAMDVNCNVNKENLALQETLSFIFCFCVQFKRYWMMP